jgi:DNA-binding NarL/FixJ family response regulator
LHQRRIYFGVRQPPVLRAALKAAAHHHYEFAGFFEKPPAHPLDEPNDGRHVWLIDLQMLRSALHDQSRGFDHMRRSGLIVVAVRDNELSRLQEYEAFIDGFVTVEKLSEHLGDAILLAASSHSMLPLEALASRSMAAQRWQSELAPDQQFLLRLLAQGMTNKQIAATMNIRPEAVKSTIRRLLGRFGFRNRTEAAVLAARSVRTFTEH